MSFILDLLYPRRCYGCGRTGSYFCPQCSSKLIYQSVKPHYPAGFDGTLSLFHYDGPIKSAIGDLKFNFVSDLVSELSTLMVSALQSQYSHLLTYWQQSGFTLIPIPLHPSRARWRGFNQSELLCQELSSKLKIPCNPDILIRSKNTQPQAQIKNKSYRSVNVNSSFALSDFSPSCQRGGRGRLNKVILVDDVATTGSTLSSALSVFPKSTEAWALTIAG